MAPIITSRADGLFPLLWPIRRRTAGKVEQGPHVSVGMRPWNALMPTFDGTHHHFSSRWSFSFTLAHSEAYRGAGGAGAPRFCGDATLERADADVRWHPSSLLEQMVFFLYLGPFG